MKRSKKVLCSYMHKNLNKGSFVSLAVTSIALAGCSNSNQEAHIYQTLNDCIKDNPSAHSECKAAYQKALTDAARTAPKYKTADDCRADFGSDTCIQAPSNNWFMPAMAGFMFARVLGGSQSYYSQPMFSSFYPYSPYYNRWTTANGRDYGSSRYTNTRVNISKKNMQPKPTVKRTISRGGFGSTASAKSSWGSSTSYSSNSSRSRGGWGG